jgi:acyl carrier protein
MAEQMIDKELFEKVQSLLAEVFEVESTEINEETQFGDIPKWDSMGHMDLMVALESQFGLEISADTISGLVSIEAILESIQAKQNG